MAEETVGGQGADPKTDAKNIIAQLESMLDEYMVKNAPFNLPMGLKEFLAMIAPYLTILGIIVSIPAILLLFGIGGMMAPLAMMGAYGYGWGPSMMITSATLVITVVLQAMAVQGLFARTHAAWRLMFYASLVQLVGGVLAMNLISAIIGAIISLYIVFQMKEMYKK